MPRFLRAIFVLLILGVLIGGPWAYQMYRESRVRNFHEVRAGVLYRSGQLSLAGLKRLIHDHGIQTVVTLRETRVLGEEPPDQAEEEFCRKEGYNFYRLPPLAWWASEGPAPAEKNVALFRQIMSDPKNYPVLVHCFAGIHRTGTFCAIYRMEFEGWSSAQAIAEMRALGYADDHMDVMGYLKEYRPQGLALPAGPGEPPQVRPAVFQGDR